MRTHSHKIPCLLFLVGVLAGVTLSKWDELALKRKIQDVEYANMLLMDENEALALDLEESNALFNAQAELLRECRGAKNK